MHVCTYTVCTVLECEFTFLYPACTCVCVFMLYMCMSVGVSVCVNASKHSHHNMTLPTYMALSLTSTLPCSLHTGTLHTLKDQLLRTFLATSANLSECCWHGRQRTQCPRCPALLVPPSVRGRHCTETCRTNTRTHW